MELFKIKDPRELFLSNQSEQIYFLTQSATTVLEIYGIYGAQVHCINFLTNATFSVLTDSGKKYALRINFNAKRTRENLSAEAEWVRFLGQFSEVAVAIPKKNLDGSYVTIIRNADTNQELRCILYSWLDGDEIGGNPSLIHLKSLGQIMAMMHKSASHFKLSAKTDLPVLRDLLWGGEDFLFGGRSILSRKHKRLLLQAGQHIQMVTEELFKTSARFVIHADIHGRNVISDDNLMQILDFDNCGIGLAVQDIAIALYYLETSQQHSALLAGYESVMPLPEFSDIALKTLLMQRRLMQLNFLYETQNPEYKRMLPGYLNNTIERVSAFLTDVRG